MAREAAQRHEIRSRARPGRLRRLVPPVVGSCLLHSVVFGSALVWWRDHAPGAPMAPAIVLVDLGPAADANDHLGDLQAVKPFGEPPAAAQTPPDRIQAVVDENAELAGRLADEQLKTAQLEAAHRQEIAALETAKSQLGEQVAALVADHAALAAEVTEERRRAIELEKELTARRAAETAAAAETRTAYEKLVAALRSEIADKDVALEQARGGLTVAIEERVLFPSGQATLTSEGQPVIDKVGAALAAVPDQAILVEGHTDNVPIGSDLRAQFPSNWELSTARADEVVKRLIGTVHISSNRLSAVGRADTEPVASNETEEGRRRNRRIEIVLLPARPTAPAESPSLPPR
jgi:chemotaxis protein MotB